MGRSMLANLYKIMLVVTEEAQGLPTQMARPMCMFPMLSLSQMLEAFPYSNLHRHPVCLMLAKHMETLPHQATLPECRKLQTLLDPVSTYL